MLHDRSHRLGDHYFFVRVHHPHGCAAGVSRNYLFSVIVAHLMQLHTKEAKLLTDARPNYWRVLADSASENKRVEPTERRRKASNAFPDLITEHRDCLGGATVMGFAAQQITYIGTGIGYSEQAGLMIDHMIELFGRHLFGLRKIPKKAWVKIA